MMRPIRIELRRSNAAAVLLLVIVLGAGNIVTSYSWWAGYLQQFLQTLTAGMFVLAPLALAGGTVLGRREIRNRATGLMDSTGRPRWQRAFPAMAAIGLGSAAGYLLILAAGVIVTVATGGYLGPWGVAWALIDALILAGASWVGIAAGRAWPSPILPPALAVSALVLQLLASNLSATPTGQGPWAGLSLEGNPVPATPWETPTTGALLARLALAAGLLAAGFLLAAGRSWFTRAGAGVALVAGLAGVVLIATPGQAGKWRLDPAAQRLVCTDDDGPQVCVTAVNAFMLPETTRDARRALAALAKLPGAPTRAAEVRMNDVGNHSSEQWRRSGPLDEPGTVYFVLDRDPVRGWDPDLTENIVLGAGTFYRSCARSGDLPFAVAGAWLLGTDGIGFWTYGFGDVWEPIQPEVREHLRQLRAIPEAEQTARVVAMRDAALRCEPDLLPYLTGEAKP
ncbi:ABC transporter permease [Catenuloplanes japonicus]|uniref:ABC transporter permease n=1 Tax=Catenuloplanes japonicus TaxID=33876 RepID=UPI0005266CBD|nr:ABC transporter permease [Catenuloplanes japonicus]